MQKPPFADSLFGPAPEAHVRVALPVPIDSLFSYAVPAALVEEARPGCRAIVPFSGRHLAGVIVDREPPEPERKGTLACLERVVDPEPVLDVLWMRVLAEAANEVLCPVGLALAAALPPGSAPRMIREAVLTARGKEALGSGAATPAAREILEALSRGSASAAALRRRTRDADAWLRELERDGLVQWHTIDRGPAAREATRRVATPRPGVDLADALSQLARAPRQAEILRRVFREGAVDAAQLGAAAPLRELERRGYIELHRQLAPRDVLGTSLEGPDAGATVEPTESQRDVLVPICDAVRGGRFEQFLLHGVTGSGKTEVYMRAVAAALDAGRQALVLVPEITLTHQIVARLRGRFGDQLAVLHSGLRPGERLEQWQRLRRGDTPIAVGARSALFAPLARLGLIVIDEEHDGAYKNDEGFRYHARDLAARRARAMGCPVVLGSATPAIETRFAADQGVIQRLVLPRRIAGRPLPAVQMVDLARERDKNPRGRKLIITRPLRRAMQETLDAGAQTILFLNRRGFSTQILCFDCGHAERCKDCDVALVFHSSENHLRCHYCDHQRPPPAACAGCGAPDTALLGVGTERLEEEVRMVFPSARIARLDRDAARRRGYTESVLRSLRQGNLDILIGTQMVAKGHDFPGVRLVGVIAADLGLHLPDFRAAERTFQLLTQVAGRAGRDALPGRVVVQTFVPEHYAVRPVAEHDYETFYRQELDQRASLGYPPCGRLSQVMVSGEDAAATHRVAEALVAGARGDDPLLGIEILGPSPAALPRLRGKYRVQILIKGADRDAVRLVAARFQRGAAALRGGVQATVDVDPVSML